MANPERQNGPPNGKPTSRDLSRKVQDELPDLTSDQIDLALWVAQMALVEDRPNFRLYGNRDGELCARPEHEEKPLRAS